MRDTKSPTDLLSVSSAEGDHQTSPVNSLSLYDSSVTLHDRAPFKGSCVAIPGSFSYPTGDSNEKYCDYICESHEDGIQFMMTGPGSGGQCIGADVRTKPNSSGELSDYAVGYDSFSVNTDDLLDLFFGKSEFDQAAEAAYNRSRW